jgi:hypothetical protein
MVLYQGEQTFDRLIMKDPGILEYLCFMDIMVLRWLPEEIVEHLDHKRVWDVTCYWKIIASCVP